ncbi:DUF6265 family protein [Chitinimonas koreensis]|uniref:DUF6265 family protein n=1 Tax=Chitinimonas koreensis TaxID=356302 RepID=UPI0006875EDD|nr:DUF6265 family protein [Chitinimonas koreensis]QNM96193.1 hypothetical protein H9L41_20670 [Chitinimonas koreensis]
MPRARALPVLAAALLALAGPARAADMQASSLAWLAGCWAAEHGEAGSGEHWLPPAGGTLLGVSRTVRNGQTVAHEFMQIRSDAEGRLVYIALPSGQREATFTATLLDAQQVAFENPAHDFPQRIVYRLQQPDRLLARIEGTRKGIARAVDFPLRRVPCEPVAER